ncbi:MAG: molecular chaperone HtpG [Bacteroidales bacterium]|jgi:molecular chaperone HtpG|nr:molecular chaperone HtpG [Bacteroidales bacterium]MDD2264247.1 molecular chaperone HtpG [Bacteroidales bacterium]MDD2831481.1 molecular chaperone HtpG [Bacteroidales bacterium]MDD3208475.1 molecular chaperone HtpG [Bacteroidales bacterium]MDD3697112.1 molecular chaperone HtpG [Bacteroidales bacterium]
MKNKGTIGVTTQDIFPVIKKFLYSDHEIFLRELISNAVDATQKLKALAAKGDFKGEMGDMTIRISSDTEKHTITVSDRGVGMTAEEVDKYINQIAFSSAGEFLEKYKDQANNIIGHFGLGFYSSFMVAKKVEIITKSWQEGSQAVRWTCKGSPEYTMEDTEKEDRGTDIVLHLYSEHESYAQESKINELLYKYCSFLPVEIAFGKEKEWKDGKEIVLDKDRIINDVNPLWTKKPTDLKDEDYKSFYGKLYPMAEEPLFWIHLNVDYPFKLSGVLYFPKIKDKLEVTRNKIQLYCNQVFVTDNVEHIVPEFLTLLHGVIDSPDIPLNVSRSYLQSDPNVKKISSHITRKVADRLEEIFKNDRPALEEKWDNLKLFIEYGMLTEEKFYERATKFSLFKNIDGKYLSFDQYAQCIESNQKDKDNKLVYLYATNKEEQFAYISVAKEKGYDVLLLDSPLCAHFVNLLESKMKDVRFVRVDSDTPEKLIPKEDVSKPDMKEEEEKEMRDLFQDVLPKEATFTVSFENMGTQQLPVIITQGEWMRRYREMSALGGGMNFMGTMPESYNLVVNFEHPLVQKIRQTKDKDLVSQVCDLALLANNLLRGESLSTFIKRSVDLL